MFRAVASSPASSAMAGPLLLADSFFSSLDQFFSQLTFQSSINDVIAKCALRSTHAHTTTKKRLQGGHLGLVFIHDWCP